MTLLAPGAHIRNDNLFVIERSCIYVYHIPCWGLRFIHLFEPENIRQTSDIKAIYDLCICRSTDEKIKIAIQHVLNDVYQASGHCKTVEAIREMLLSVASREEMK